MKCANHFCENNLTDYQEKKLLSNKFTKDRLCLYCKRYMYKVEYISCLECGNMMMPSFQQLYCKNCFRTRRNQQQRERKRLNNRKVCV